MPCAPRRRTRSNYARWRAACLSLVYVFMAIHVVHWKIAGKTLAPLELNEVMYTLEFGIVTAGFIFMVVAVVATAVFGRFFCSWGCHILALQDLSAWILRKLGIRPRPIRSRMLLWVPMIAAAYMFAWPQVGRIASGKPMARLHLATDADGWASFTTENFWRNLPSPAVTIATFFICGFLVVYVLGTRSFCAYGCPYGAVFGLADRLAPGRIRVGSDCAKCGICTSVCSSHVRVHEELERFGMVVNPACLKDLDCVSACPQQSLHYGFGRPSMFRRVLGTGKIKRAYDFALWEEALAAVVFVTVLLIYRGLYDLVPFLLSLALAAILAYAAVVFVRLFHQRYVTFNRLHLRRAGKLTRRGVAAVAGTVAVAALTVHGAFVQYAAFQGERSYNRAMRRGGSDTGLVDRSLAHLTRAQSWGMIAVPRIERMRLELLVKRQRWPEAERSCRKILDAKPEDVHVRERLALALAGQGRFGESKREYTAALERDPARAEVYYGLAGVEFHAGRPDRAERHLRTALRVQPGYAKAHYDLGALLVERGALAEGVEHLRECVRLSPQFGDAHYNLAVALAARGALNEALSHVDRAAALQPEDERTRRLKAFLETLSREGPGAANALDPGERRR